MIRVQYCQYSLYCALDFYGLFTTFKFVLLNNIQLTLQLPGNYNFTQFLQVWLF